MTKNEAVLIRRPQLRAMIGVSDVTLWRWERDGKFPRRIKIGPQACAWNRAEIESWITEKMAGR